MNTVAATGNDIVKINGTILVDFADGDNANLTFPNDLVNVKTGKNGNTLVAFKNDGRQGELTLRLIRGSSDDKFLNNLLASFRNDPSGFVLLTGEMVKSVGDGAGNIIQDIYILSGGAFKKMPEVLENADGNTDQSLVVYTISFSNIVRSIS